MLLALCGASASALTTLPFSEGFDEGTPEARQPSNTWTFSTTSSSAYPKKWTYDSQVYIGSDKVLPRTGEGGFADIRYYTSASEYTHDSLTSDYIDLDGETHLELSFSYYQVAGNSTSTLTVEVSYDGHPFESIYSANIAAATSEWKEVKQAVDAPWGSGDIRLRFTAYNGEVGETVIFDEVKLSVPQGDAIIYPASVSDFTATLNSSWSAIDIALTAPSKSHPSLGDVRDQPIDRLSKIEISRSIDMGEYSVVKTFDNPTPGSRLTFSDTDLERGGSYFYRAVAYIDGRCDYGEYIADPIMIGQKPYDVSDLKLDSDKGNLPVTVSFVLPTTDVDGKELRGKVGAELSRYDFEAINWEIINTWSEQNPGTPLTYSDTEATAGKNYRYKVIVKGHGSDSFGATADIYIGLDQPSEPRNVAARVDNGNIVVTWDEPENGINNGYIDYENMTYMVYRGNGYSDYNAELIASGLKERRYVDTEDFPVEQLVRYFVKAVSNGFEGYSASSPLVRSGHPATLPYAEGFDNEVSYGIIADHLSWDTSSSEAAPTWAFAEMAYFMLEGQVLPYEGKGLAYSFYGPYADLQRDDYLTSGHIDLNGAKQPVARFFVYVVPGYETSLSFEVSDDDENFETLNKTDYIEYPLETPEWVAVECPLDKYIDKIISVRFHAHKGAYACSTAVDQLSIVDKLSGVDSITDSSEAAISLAGRTLNVTADNRTAVCVASLDGKTVYAGEGSTAVELAPGVYIVKAGKTAAKIIVK